MNKLSLSISLMLTITFGLKSTACGTSYALPSGSTHPFDGLFSPNGSYYATANYDSNNVTIFTVSNGVLSGGTSYSLPSDSAGPSSVAFSPDGSYLAVANTVSSNVTIFTVTGGVLNGGTSYALPSGSINPNSVVFSPDGTRLAMANNGSASTDRVGNVTLFTISAGVLNGGTSYALPAGSASPRAIAFSPNGSYLATANSGSDLPSKSDAGAGVTVFTVSAGVLNGGVSYALPSGSKDPYSVAFSPDGLYLATANVGTDSTMDDAGAGVTIFSFSSGVPTNGTSYTLPSGSTGAANSVAFSPNGSYLAIVNGVVTGAGITIFTVSSGVLSGGTSYAFPASTSALGRVVFSPDGSYVAIANFDSSNVTVFDLTCIDAPTGVITTTSKSTAAASSGSVASSTTVAATTMGATTSDSSMLRHVWSVTLGLIGVRALLI